MTPQERKVMEMALEALESVWQYGSDTLSGPVKGQSDDRKWQRDGVLEMTNRAYRPVKVIKEALAQPELEPTYTSTQATNCAGCGEHKHTPLRIDAMGGYVCLTCIDKKLGSLLGEFGYEQSEQEPIGYVNEGETDRLIAQKQETIEGLNRDYDLLFAEHQLLLKKEWVGLTKEDIDSWELPDTPTVAEFAWFVEAKLKDKNTRGQANG